MKSIYLCSIPDKLESVYSEKSRSRLTRLTECLGAVTSPALYESDMARQAEVAFSTWGMPAITDAELPRYFPNLKAVFYAAGTVQNFARPLLERGVRVFSAWQANAVPVAEFTFAQILLALKGYFQVQPLTHVSRAAAIDRCHQYPGAYDSFVGLIGCGAVGRRVARLLQNTDLQVLVCDPYLSEEDAKSLGVKKTDMADLFARCDVVSNHLPNLPATVGAIRREHLLSMKPYATFINTGRGPQLCEQDLYDALTEVPTRTALLDVMTDENKSAEKPLNTLPNCRITPHMAGSSGQEVWRMAEYMLDEFERMQRGENCPFEVSLKMLETMA